MLLTSKYSCQNRTIRDSNRTIRFDSEGKRYETIYRIVNGIESCTESLNRTIRLGWIISS